jgi:hypothetical protein
MSSSLSGSSRPTSRGPATLLSLPPQSLTYIAEFLIGTEVPECLFERDQACRTACVYTSNNDSYTPDDKEDKDDCHPSDASSDRRDHMNEHVHHFSADHFLNDHLPPNHLLLDQPAPTNHLPARSIAMDRPSGTGSRTHTLKKPKRRGPGKRPVPHDSLIMRNVRSLAGECSFFRSVAVAWEFWDYHGRRSAGQQRGST